MTSKRQAQILAYISEYTASQGYSPTVREMMEATGLSSTSAVHYHLQNAWLEGSLTYLPGRSRTWKVTPTKAK